MNHGTLTPYESTLLFPFYNHSGTKLRMKYPETFLEGGKLFHSSPIGTYGNNVCQTS